ncbi:hypothetical protein Barba22A_gp110 [Rheinheimera phage vB_RspM_Barba22A]|jgi:hypothetical protein|uniref:Dit-like phage tail protein N-terminal domain-containing protein n=85 Tax=Barbavirus TaxID=2733095 RepID=A0A7G9VRZ9_9CAUD|nr:tail fiber protein [Rheinheimera phage Barba5S]YP_009822850.1 tail fiber protein [Rheinheimera phage Barba8S]YP_009822987.1 tail fiber protein [Rheinheimera phage vB_RspM_Barba18A]YP_009823131.1 tail fiber protein [Rheinheimera phage vB_RspM_Barba19A]YP_009823269.1 tail fiber protein [Rheinheimera phage Barba21A]QCQ57961.1 hypothetical protein Barba1A_gp110 [Rheinheimera phage vB_RspM_Barba1A]QCQ58097.1 hypothetical protein Barba1S_gp110 [Rheinheimera phage vB_RspM_Barba1S]QCQ58233.1 hypo
MSQQDVVLILANKMQADKLGLGGTFLLPDCTLSIDHKFENDVTEHPIDRGSSVSDHVVNKNVTFSVSGVYNTYSLQKYVQDGVSTQNRVADAYKKLLDLRNSKQQFTLVSRYDIYQNCVVKSLSIPVAPTDGNTLIFSMEITQVRVSQPFRQVTLVQLEDVSEQFVDAAQLKKEAGTKQRTKTSTTPIVNQADKVINGGSG